MNHTKEPWYAVGAWVENPNDDAPDICNCDPAAMAQAHFDQSYEVTCANARRIVACVNACAGIETHELELMTGRMSIASQIKACDAIYATAEAKATRRSKFARQRDELLAALSRIIENMDEYDGEAPGHCHYKKGHWDKDGSKCELCEDWNNAKALIARAKGGA